MKHFIKRLILMVLFATIVAAPICFGEAPPDWRPLMKENQSALVTFNFKNGMQSVGVFVSKDGHVLACLQVFLKESLPAVALTPDNSAATVHSIVAVFPDQDLVLLKLNRRPGKWLAISEQPVELGAATAFLVRGQDAPVHAGPVLARRGARRPTKTGAPFSKVLSIGAHKPRQFPDGASSLPAGSPLIDPLGKICGVSNTVQVSEGQVLIEAAPLDRIAKAINTAIEGSGTIPFPIPKKLNPYSEVLQNPDYFKTVNALRARDTVQALKYIEALLKAHPADPVVSLLHIDILYEGGREGELEDLLTSLFRPDSMVKFDRLSLLDQRLRIFRNKRQWSQAIATAHEAVECSPPDFPATAFNLAECYVSRGKETDHRDDYLAAEKWYKIALKSGSDHIAILTSYESLLAQLQRWEESDAVTERIHELERIYQ